MGSSKTPRGNVVVYSGNAPRTSGSHEAVTRAVVGRKLAALKGYDYAGEYDPACRYDGPLYFVPAHTLLQNEARELGIVAEDDLFGGVVPYAFTATKTITHPLVAAGAFAPVGWSNGLAGRLSGAVLQGFSAFTISDARLAVERLLERGSARIKEARGIGGRGQSVISSADELDALVNAMDPDELASYGVVLEENLEGVTTYSVGQVHVSDLWITYYGRQRLTTNHQGSEVYGGSELIVMRGHFDALLGLELTAEARLAVTQARRYDAAAASAFPGFLASRRNYDVALGGDREGRQRCGVLEQSWRIGGATPAEIAALVAFAADPELRTVRASSWEFFGAVDPPPHAQVYFRGVDERVGAMTKYSIIEAYGNQT